MSIANTSLNAELVQERLLIQRGWSRRQAARYWPINNSEPSGTYRLPEGSNGSSDITMSLQIAEEHCLLAWLLRALRIFNRHHDPPVGIHWLGRPQHHRFG